MHCLLQYNMMLDFCLFSLRTFQKIDKKSSNCTCVLLPVETMIHSKHDHTPLTEQNPLEICSEELLLCKQLIKLPIK